MRSLLLLDETIVDSIHIKTDLLSANDDVDDPIKSSGPDVDMEILRVENSRQFMIPMRIRMSHQTADIGRGGFALDLKLVGYFSFDEDVDEQQIASLMTLNAPSILYGVARGIAAQCLAMTAVGRFLLPSVNFVEILKKREQRMRRQHRKKVASLTASTTP